MSGMSHHVIPETAEESATVSHRVEDSDKESKEQDSASKQDGAAKREIEEEVTLTFPQRLMEILDDEEQNDIVAWLPHGQGFMIYKKKAFEVNVMSRFFKQSKFTSFTRKLNRWGFTRVTRGPETGAYYHKFFKRGQTRLCLQMSCQSSKAQPETWMKPQGMMVPGPAAPQMGGLMMPGLNQGPGGVSSLMGAAAAAAGSNALLQQQLMQLQQQQALQQLQQQELLRRAMASQTSNSLYLQLLQGKATSGGMGTDPMLMAQLQSTARNAAANNTMAYGAAVAAQQQQQQQHQQQQQQQQSRSDNNGGSPDSTRSAGEIRRALAA